MSGTPLDEEAIFKVAYQIASPLARAEYLTQVCGEDRQLFDRVDLLLRLHDQQASFLEAGPTGVAATLDQPVSERPGTVIGPYKLLEQIGEGGFGIVFMAEQAQPVRRKVALKVLKPGMDTRQVVARFEVERQALAIMDHPNIAKVLDGGATASGRPYFVMELVKGSPITDHCDQNHLSPRARLELFVTVCHAVQHAHQKGIIHRDLKPSNVLVTMHDATPVVRVIDFGVAKALGQELTDKSLFTGFAQMIGTPLYMSPEQAGQSSCDVDTRSDIYSLGVVLYELLTGTTPFDTVRLRTATCDEIRRIIRDEEPPPPSTRVSTLARAATTASNQRRGDPRRLIQELRGELDWIVMKALEKDRTRRYETASDLAADLRRFLTDEPVVACPPSSWYRFRKFTKRHRGVVGGVAGAVLALVLLVVGLVVHNVQITRERDDKQSALDAADAQQRRAQANLQHSLDAISGMLDLTEQHLSNLPQAEAVREKFLQAALESCQRIADAEGGDPATRRLTARAYTQVGRIKANLGNHIEAEFALRRALELFVQLADDNPHDSEVQADRAAGQCTLGAYLRTRGNTQEAESLFLQCVMHWRHVSADPASKPSHRRDLAFALHELGYLQWSVDRYSEAEKSYQEALALLRDLHAEFPDEAADSRWIQVSLQNALGVLLRTTGRLPEAEQIFRQALQFGADEGRSRLHLGVVLWMLGRMEESERHQRETVRLGELLVSQYPKGPEGRGSLALAYRWLSLLLYSTGNDQEAEETLLKAIRLQETLVTEFPDGTNFQENLAGTRRYLGNLLRDTARYSEAETAYRAALSFQEAKVEQKVVAVDDLAAFALTCKDFGNLLSAMGKSEDAKPFFDKARQGLRQAIEFQSQRYTLHDQLARFLAACPDPEFRDPSGAVASAKKAVELAPQVGGCWTALGIAHYRIGRWQEAVDALQRAGELRAGGDSVDWFFLAMARWQLGDKEQARTWYDRAVQWVDKHQPQNEELIRFRAEASELLDIADQAKPKKLESGFRLGAKELGVKEKNM